MSVMCKASALCAALILGLLPRSAQAFRSAMDLPAISSTSPVTWPNAQIRLALSADLPTSLRFTEVESAIYEALELWSAPTCSGATLMYEGLTNADAVWADETNTIQIIISGWEARGFDKVEAAVTDVQYKKEPSGWVIAEADVYVNAETYRWVQSENPDLELAGVLAHEFGHVLGLLHTCEPDGKDGAPICTQQATGQIMDPFYDSSQRALGDDDVKGICYLYPEQECQGQECDNGITCALDDCTCKEPDCSSNYDPNGGTLGESAELVERYAEPGDPCAVQRGCGPLACHSGVCLKPCEAGDVCADGECNTDASPPVCTPPGRVTGSSCEDASECVGGQCLSGLTAFPVCTRECNGERPCPRGWACREADGLEVCAPPKPVEGCSCSQVDRAASGWGGLLLGAYVLLVTIARPGHRYYTKN